MAAFRVNPRNFQRRYMAKTKALAELARDLPDRPTADQIHDLRVTARRIQVMRGLLPRRVRQSQTSGNFGPTLKSVLKATSDLRDLDTLIDTLELHRGGLPIDLLVTLENQRSDVAAQAKAATQALAEAPPPKIDSSLVRRRKLSKKLRRGVRKRSRVAAGLLAKVLEDEANVEELHSLRKEVKKLRYLLELADEIPMELPVLTKWQESLGVIRDLDVATSYLEGSRVALSAKAVGQLRRSRHLNYLKFIGESPTDSVEAFGGGGAFVGARPRSP